MDALAALAKRWVGHEARAMPYWTWGDPRAPKVNMTGPTSNFPFDRFPPATQEVLPILYPKTSKEGKKKVLGPTVLSLRPRDEPTLTTQVSHQTSHTPTETPMPYVLADSNGDDLRTDTPELQPREWKVAYPPAPTAPAQLVEDLPEYSVVDHPQPEPERLLHDWPAPSQPPPAPEKHAVNQQPVLPEHQQQAPPVDLQKLVDEWTAHDASQPRPPAILGHGTHIPQVLEPQLATFHPAQAQEDLAPYVIKPQQAPGVPSHPPAPQVHHVPGPQPAHDPPSPVVLEQTLPPHAVPPVPPAAQPALLQDGEEKWEDFALIAPKDKSQGAPYLMPLEDYKKLPGAIQPPGPDQPYSRIQRRQESRLVEPEHDNQENVSHLGARAWEDDPIAKWQETHFADGTGAWYKRDAAIPESSMGPSRFLPPRTIQRARTGPAIRRLNHEKGKGLWQISRHGRDPLTEFGISEPNYRREVSDDFPYPVEYKRFDPDRDERFNRFSRPTLPKYIKIGHCPTFDPEFGGKGHSSPHRSGTKVTICDQLDLHEN